MLWKLSIIIRFPWLTKAKNNLLRWVDSVQENKNCLHDFTHIDNNVNHSKQFDSKLSHFSQKLPIEFLQSGVSINFEGIADFRSNLNSFRHSPIPNCTRIYWKYVAVLQHWIDFDGPFKNFANEISENAVWETGIPGSD